MTDIPKNLPLYQSIFEHYRKQIEGGLLLPGDPLPSEAQMAQLYGVSNITARRALNELRRQGLAVRERGRGSFVASPSPTRASSEPMDRVMLIFPKDSQYTKAAECIATLYTLLERRGYYLGVHFSDDSEAREEQLLRQAIAEQVRGILLYPVSSLGNLPTLLLIREMRLPLVLMDRAHLVQGFPVAASDNVSGGRMLADYLLSRGYEHILFVTNQPLSHATSLRDRYHGYITALLHSGRSVRDTFLVLLENSERMDTPAHQNLLAYLHSARRPVALMCATDPIAIALLPFLQANGLRVPEDVAVTGFDNLQLSSRTSPPLTTVQQDFSTLAQISGELLLNAMESANAPAKLRQTPVSLVVRESTR